jgi:alcohol dehydrogenase class IV
LRSLSPYQKSATTLDALCQAIESYWSVNATEQSKNYAKRAIRLILDNMRDYFDGSSQANEKMLLAANLAGRAINISQTTAAHALCYKITSIYNIAHGHAVAICLPEVWRYMARRATCGESFLEIANLLDCSDVDGAINKMKNIADDLGLKAPTIKNNELELLADSVNQERLKNSPVQIDRDGILEIYSNIFIN